MCKIYHMFMRYPVVSGLILTTWGSPKSNYTGVLYFASIAKRLPAFEPVLELIIARHAAIF